MASASSTRYLPTFSPKNVSTPMMPSRISAGTPVAACGLLERRLLLRHEPRAARDATLGQEARAVLVPGQRASRPASRSPRGSPAAIRPARAARRATSASKPCLLPTCSATKAAMSSRVGIECLGVRGRRTADERGQRAQREGGRRYSEAGRWPSGERSVSRGDQFAVRVDRHEDTEAGQQGHHRCAAVADERQRHADDRQQPATMPLLTNT